MLARSGSFFLMAAIALIAPSIARAAAAENLVRHLPDGALGTLEISGLSTTIERLQDSDLAKAYLETSYYTQFINSDQGKKATAFQALAEGQLGMSLWDFAKIYLGDRLALGVYPPSAGKEPDGVVIVQAKSDDDFAKLLAKVTPLLALAGDAVTLSDEDNAKVLTFKDGNRAIVKGHWLVVSKNRQLLDQTLRNLESRAASGLENGVAWKTMTQQMGGNHTAQLCVNLARIQEIAGKSSIPEKLDNPGVSLFYGGLLACAAKSPYLGVTLDIREDSVSLKTAVSGKTADLAESHRASLVDTSKRKPPLVPAVPNRLGVISFSRDLSTWYKSREQLLEAKLQPEFDKFETGIATFIPDKDFAEDVLSLLTGRIALVAAPQDYSFLDGKPGVQVPSFGLVVELAKPAEGSDLLNLVSQTILTISNFEASKQKRQPWVQTSESYRDVQINFARYLQRPKGNELPIAYNFQPASALVDDRFIMSTSVGLCRQLIDAAQEKNAPPAAERATAEGSTPNLVQEISPSLAAQLIEDNAAVIKARLIRDGKTAEQSDRDLQMVCQLLRRMLPIRFDAVQYSDHMALEVHVGWK